jgi:hypothetical protein
MNFYINLSGEDYKPSRQLKMLFRLAAFQSCVPDKSLKVDWKAPHQLPVCVRGSLVAAFGYGSAQCRKGMRPWILHLHPGVLKVISRRHAMKSRDRPKA